MSKADILAGLVSAGAALADGTITATELGLATVATSGSYTDLTDKPTSYTVDGVNPVGYLEIPQNVKSANYTLVLSDSGEQITKTGTGAFTVTIPANTSVAFPIGTVVTFVNNAASGNLTIAITTDTLRLAGSSTTGSRTLAAYGIATAVKVGATVWMITGAGLT